jgi:hypothetical protein
VGIFMDDENLEDGLSFLFVGVIVILMIAGIVTTSKKLITGVKTETK